MAATIALVTTAVKAGIDLVQIRERDLDDRSRLALTRAAVDAARGSRARILVNERLDIALAAGADGVHLRGDSVAASSVRRHGPPGFIIGRSVHSRDEAVAAEREGGCDYLIFGTVFSTTSKPEGHPSLGTGALKEVCARVRLPVLAIGGISVDRAPDVAAAGAEGVRSTIEALRRAFDTQ